MCCNIATNHSSAYRWSRMLIGHTLDNLSMGWRTECNAFNFEISSLPWLGSCINLTHRTYKSHALICLSDSDSDHSYVDAICIPLMEFMQDTYHSRSCAKYCSVLIFLQSMRDCVDNVQAIHHLLRKHDQDMPIIRWECKIVFLMNRRMLVKTLQPARAHW